MASKPSSALSLLGAAAVVSIGYYLYRTRVTKNENTEKKSDRVLSFSEVLIDLQLWIEKDTRRPEYIAECKKAALALHKYGVLVCKDPRVVEADNDRFVDMMERYFEGSDGVRDARPEFAYQVGVTPSFVERPRNHCSRMGGIGPDDKPLSVCPPELDPKWRFFWRIGPQPKKTNFPGLNADPVIPPEIPEWANVMDGWGYKMLDAIEVLSEMAAIGFNLPADSFTKKMNFGPHLLAPTGSDFNRFGASGTVLAGYHYDLNFLTIHGKSRFPGLHVWTRSGERVGVKIPDGCLLVQAGKQIEYLTGGHVLAGYHEVVVTDATIKTIEKRKAENKSLWRVSSTLFGHLQSDQVLEPLGHFATPESLEAFPKKFAGEQVRDELQAIALDKN